MKKRLDEILIGLGLVTEDQIKEALMRQRAHGGRLGSQLIYYRYIDEAGLVKALSIQHGCQGITLADLEIPDMLLEFIPEKVALTRKVIPFDYNPESNRLSVACIDPNDQDLINELNFVARGKQIKLFVAAEIAIETAISRYYHGQQVTLNDRLLLELPDITLETGQDDEASEITVEENIADYKATIMIVTDERFAAPMLQSILERDDYRVIISENTDQAIDLLDSEKLHTVFIKDTLIGDYLKLIDRIRRVSPSTTVHCYHSLASLILGDDESDLLKEINTNNLDLFTSLLSYKYKSGINHGGQVGRYTDKLCRRIGLPDRDRRVIVNAGYVHDLAAYYYGDDESGDGRRLITLTIKLLSSMNYSPVIVEILRHMYVDVDDKYKRTLPIEVLGGNILTIVDLFCESIPPGKRLTLDKFDAIRKKLRGLSGRLFLPDIVEAFIDMIQQDILSAHTFSTSGQIMIFGQDAAFMQLLGLRLKNEGYGTIAHNAAVPFGELYRRSEPDLIVILPHESQEHYRARLEEISDCGVDLKKTPVFLLAEPDIVSDLTVLLDQGAEDIIARDDNFDLLISKVNRWYVKKNAGGDSPGGARGRLSDMNLIDLLQALGPSRKTVRIVVCTESPEPAELILWLKKGDLVYAATGDLTGDQAVYRGLTWAEGSWQVLPAEAEEFPESNIEASNEAILMEGCRLIDEQAKSGQLL